MYYEWPDVDNQSDDETRGKTIPVAGWPIFVIPIRAEASGILEILRFSGISG